MHQHQPLSFASKLDCFPISEKDDRNIFTTEMYEQEQFLTPVLSPYCLNDTELKRLREHYFTVYEDELQSDSHELRDMERRSGIIVASAGQYSSVKVLDVTIRRGSIT